MTLPATRSIVRALAGLEVGETLDAIAARRLAALTPDEAARVLAELCARAPAEPDERKVLGAMCRALLLHTAELPHERRREIRRAAFALGLPEVVTLFIEAEARRTVEEPPESRAVTNATGSATLGHRKQGARNTRDPQRLVRFLRDDHPQVIRNLLLNPRLTEPLVVRLASRRPIPADVLLEVARAPRWCVLRAVRRALALNPYSPPSLVTPILAQLDVPDLREVAATPMLHPAIRASAESFLRARSLVSP